MKTPQEIIKIIEDEISHNIEQSTYWENRPKNDVVCKMHIGSYSDKIQALNTILKKIKE